LNEGLKFNVDTFKTHSKETDLNANNLLMVKDVEDELKKFEKKENEYVEIKHPEFKNLKLEDLKSIKFLGKGIQGTVEQVVHVPSGKMLALKSIILIKDDKFVKHLK